MKKISLTQRIIKDLQFLLALPKQNIADGIIKRTESQGKGEKIKNIKVPCHIFVSFYKYDYEGRYHSHCINTCIRDFSNRSNSGIPIGVYIAIGQMKIEQKAWFNFQSPDLHGVIGISHGGCHFLIVIEDIKYRNADNFQSKKLVSEQLRKQAAELYKNGDYQEGLKRYKKQINITEGLDKKKYTKQQLEQSHQINTKAKQNFLRCFNKLTNFEDNLSDMAENYSKQLLKQYPNDVVNLFLRARVLMQRKYLTLALEFANELAKKNEEEGVKLIAQIQQKIKKNV